MDRQRFILDKLSRLKEPFYLSVNGDSMSPTINSGDNIYVNLYKKDPLGIGDIVVYCKFQDHLTVHRIINIVKLSNKRFYCETKGDNNTEIDPYKVFSNEIIGIVQLERTE